MSNVRTMSPQFVVCLRSLPRVLKATTWKIVPERRNEQEHALVSRCTSGCPPVSLVPSFWFWPLLASLVRLACSFPPSGSLLLFRWCLSLLTSATPSCEELAKGARAREVAFVLRRLANRFATRLRKVRDCVLRLDRDWIATGSRNASRTARKS